MLLGQVNVQVNTPSAVSASTDLFDLRGAQYDSVTGTLSVQVWANPTAATASLDLSASATNSSNVNFTSTLNGSWLSAVNPVSGTVSFSAFIGDANNPGVTGPLQVGTLSVVLSNPTQSTNVSFNGLELGEISVNSLNMTLANATTATPGTFDLQGLGVGPAAISVSRGTSDTGSAITSADALAALRIATGVNPNVDPDGAGPLTALKLSPYQFMAADVNKDGKVSSADALAILRMATNHATALPKEWFFVKETQDLWNEATNSSALTRSNTSWTNELNNQTLNSGNNNVNLVGVLKGDVNGNWAAPVGSIDLDNTNPTYFQLLGAQLGMPTDVWGL